MPPSGEINSPLQPPSGQVNSPLSIKLTHYSRLAPGVAAEAICRRSPFMPSATYRLPLWQPKHKSLISRVQVRETSAAPKRIFLGSP